MKTQTKNLAVGDFKRMQDYSLLNLQPSYQRNPVWSDRQKVYLIDSILNGYPLPKLFIREIYEENQTEATFEIVDGQQRLTTMLEFSKNEFALLKSKHPEPSEFDISYDKKFYKDLSLEDKKKIMNYSLTCESLEGTEEEIRQMFYRINSSSKSLNKQEILNSQYAGDFKSLIYKLAKVHKDKFLNNKTIQKAGVKRMEVESLITQCIIGQIDGVVDENKDRHYYKTLDSWNKESVEKHEQDFQKVFKIINDIFEDKIKETHFRTKNSYIALHEFFHTMLFKNNKRLSKNNYDDVQAVFLRLNSNINKEGTGLGKEWYDCSLKSVGNINNRFKRKEILDKSLSEFFNQKDFKRNFTGEERLTMWSMSEDKKCALCNEKIESYEDYDLDHIIMHKDGGATVLENAQITHKTCNRRKNNS
jgi:hypothetical protein